MAHPARHFFEAKELKNIFEETGFSDTQLGSSPCLVTGMRDQVEAIANNTVAWETMLRQELKVYKTYELSNVGEFLMIKGRK